jgi:hypothetical protein
MKRLLTVIVLFATITSCKKSSDTTVKVPNTSYSPLNVGSTWTYLRNSSDSAYKDSVYKFTATDSTVSFGDTVYTVVNSTAGGNIYYAVKDTGYFRKGSLLSSLGLEELSSFAEFYLPKNLVKNQTWTNKLSVNYQGTQLPVTIAYTLKATADDFTVLGNKFTKVAHVGAVFTTSMYGFSLSLGSGNFYYAQGIGLISFNLSTTDPTQPTKPAVTNTFNLKSYSIK